jgi:hypothetical protein
MSWWRVQEPPVAEAELQSLIPTHVQNSGAGGYARALVSFSADMGYSYIHYLIEYLA